MNKLNEYRRKKWWKKEGREIKGKEGGNGGSGKEISEREEKIIGKSWNE